MSWLFQLLILFRPYLGWILLGILVSTMTLFANVALMAISGWFITAMALAGAAGVSMNYFTPAAIIRATAIIRTGGRYLERLVTHEATFRLLAQLRVWFYRHLEPQVPIVFETHRSGDLLSLIRADIDTLDNLYVRVLVPVSVALIGIITLTLVMSVYDAQLALILLSMLLLAGLVLPVWIGRLGQKPGKQVIDTSSALRTSVVDGVQGMAELTVCGATEEVARKVAETSRQLIQAQEKMSHVAGFSQTGMLLISNLTLWAVMLVAIPLTVAGSIEPQELAMLALFTMAAFESVMPLPEAFRMLGLTRASANRLFDLVNQAPVIREPTVGKVISGLFDIQFDAVDFRYSEKTPQVLKNINLNLTPGIRMGVVGPTGSGKSTLIQLLLRFREPENGEIRLSDTSLSEFNGEDIREKIAVVPQKVYLFNTTIRDNLKVANPDANAEMLEKACRVAQIHDFIISQPDGYDTWVGETGIKLSGGQARRIAIARALLRDFQLLVLDEPGEGLDMATQQAMMESLYDHLGDRGLLIITHQSVGLDRLDEIVVLENGRIVERGDFKSLLRTNGRFTELMNSDL